MLQKCPTEIIELMQQCWHEDPSLRPEFGEIAQRLDDICRKYGHSAPPSMVTAASPILPSPTKQVDSPLSAPASLDIPQVSEPIQQPIDHHSSNPSQISTPPPPPPPMAEYVPFGTIAK